MLDVILALNSFYTLCLDCFQLAHEFLWKTHSAYSGCVGTMHLHLFLSHTESVLCNCVQQFREECVECFFLCLCVPTRKKSVFSVCFEWACRQCSYVWDTAKRMFIGAEGLRVNHRSAAF